MTAETFSDAPALARALIKRYGHEWAHFYAYARAHSHEHHGAVGDWRSRLEWGRVVSRIQADHDRAERQRLEAERRALFSARPRTLNVRKNK